MPLGSAQSLFQKNSSGGACAPAGSLAKPACGLLELRQSTSRKWRTSPGTSTPSMTPRAIATRSTCNCASTPWKGSDLTAAGSNMRVSPWRTRRRRYFDFRQRRRQWAARRRRRRTRRWAARRKVLLLVALISTHRPRRKGRFHATFRCFDVLNQQQIDARDELYRAFCVHKQDCQQAEAGSKKEAPQDAEVGSTRRNLRTRRWAARRRNLRT